MAVKEQTAKEKTRDADEERALKADRALVRFVVVSIRSIPSNNLSVIRLLLFLSLLLLVLLSFGNNIIHCTAHCCCCCCERRMKASSLIRLASVN